MADIVNVLLHGVYGYFLRPECIEVYTPAVCGHIYRAGSVDYNEAEDLRRVTYSLHGVAGDSENPLPLDYDNHPIVPLSDDHIDPFTKRYCMFRLPYPEKISEYTKQFYAVDAYKVGSIFAGRDSGPLDGLQSCPSLFIFVYARNESFLRLDPDDGGKWIDLSHLDPKPGTNIVNVHFWCTINPDDTGMAGMTPCGHLRKSYAALVDFVPSLEVTLEVPEKFFPTACTDNPPPGVGPCDIDPANCISIAFGKVNCHHSNLIFVPKGDNY